MRQSISGSIFMLVGILASLTLIMFIGMLGSKSHQMSNDRIYKEAVQDMWEKAAEAYPYTDISRKISGDDVIEFITDNGAAYSYYIWFVDENGNYSPDTFVDLTTNSDEYNKAKNAVRANLKGVTSGEAEIYASTAVWSQYYLSANVFKSKITRNFIPEIRVNKTGSESKLTYADLYNDTGKGWTTYKDYANKIQYTFLDTIDSEDEFVIVYREENEKDEKD